MPPQVTATLLDAIGSQWDLTTAQALGQLRVQGISAAGALYVIRGALWSR